MVHISHKTGFGLPIDGSADESFFSHGFGHKIGERTGVVNALPGGGEVEVFSMYPSEIAKMKLQRGRKRKLATPLANSRVHLKNDIQQLKRLVQDEKVESCTKLITFMLILSNCIMGTN